MKNVIELTLHAADGYPLAASHFTAAGDQFIVVGSATAVPRGFYRRFAQFAQARGINVVTIDYRGIGQSKHGSLKTLDIDFGVWSRHDLATAVDYAAQRGRVWLVGHSLGGHAIGQLPNPNVLQAAYVCGAGAGWHGWMPRTERVRVWLLWNLIGPALTRWYGYTPLSKLGIGEDMPRHVFEDWKRWCRYPHYFFDDPDAKAITDKFAQVHIPIAAAASVDDVWSPPRSRDALFQGYPGAAVDLIDLTPSTLGVRKVGHMGYFRGAVGERLWPQILQWLGWHGLEVKAV